MKQEVITQSIQSTPALAILGAAIVSITINQWLAAVSIAFILLQAAYLVWKWIREAKKD